MEDITDRKRTERVLKEAERRERGQCETGDRPPADVTRPEGAAKIQETFLLASCPASRARPSAGFIGLATNWAATA